MKKMIAVFIYFSIAATSCSPVNLISTDSYPNIVTDYIKKDMLQQKEYANMKDSLYFEHAHQSISFDLLNLSESIIADNYITDFTYENRTTNTEEKKIIIRVKDSLKNTTNILNKSCAINSLNKKNDHKIIGMRNKGIIFSSILCHNQIYVKVIPSFGVIDTEQGFEFYGRALIYLFSFDSKKTIKKVYKGKIEYN